MTQTTKVTREALALSIQDRAKLASRLIRSIDEPSAKELEKMWVEEAEARSDACAKGLSKLIPLEEVKRQVEQRVRK